MPPHEIIEGPKLHQLIRQLMAEQTLIKLSLPRTAYTRLTVITHLQPQKKPCYFRIDPPRGVKAAIEANGIQNLDFEFSDRDRVTHLFETQLHSTTGEDLWLHFPQSIRRIQQRENVRVDAGAHSFVQIDIAAKTVKLPIVNISSGGALCACLTAYKSTIGPGQQWEHAALELTLAGDVYHITIDRLQVLRLATSQRPRHFNIALEFRQIERQNYRKLVHFINACQRKMLQERRQSL